MNILIIGGGNMGLTFAKSFIHSHVVTPEQLTILEKNQERVEHLKSLKIARIFDDATCVKEADLIILAVKPQNAKELFAEIFEYVDKDQVLLSIMAGVKIETIQEHLKLNKIIRAMPNLPAQIGLGMTGFTATEAVSRFELGAIQNLLSTTGKTLLVEDESTIDKITAISGSGPAYMFYFLEAMISAAREMDFKKGEAELLVVQTFHGALQLFQQNNLTCDAWIDRVASKGGTTEAAIRLFNQKGVHQHIIDGTKAAWERAIELGK
jgi:pyrroline-5-carboxylate reductase